VFLLEKDTTLYITPNVKISEARTTLHIVNRRHEARCFFNFSVRMQGVLTYIIYFL